ncbi:MAG: hypothetical protein ACRCU2_23320 [Planktothrix sp.]
MNNINNNDDDNYQKKLSDFGDQILSSSKKLGIKITSAGVGAAIGTFVAGPPGAIGGAALGTLCEEALSFIDRSLSQKEEERVKISAIYAYEKITKYLQDGRSPRKDDFFDEKINCQSKANEILEGVLTKCKAEYQDKKIKFISNIYANAAFREDTSVDELHHILEIADRLTYREICILAFITKPGGFHSTGEEKIGLIFPSEYAFEPREQNSLVDRWTIYPYFEKSNDFYFLHQELNRLNELNLIGRYYWSYPVDKNKLPTYLRKGTLEHSVFLYDFSQNTHPFAFKLSKIMELDEIEEADLNELRKNIVAPVTLEAKAEKEILGINTFVSQPSYLVNNSSSN